MNRSPEERRGPFVLFTVLHLICSGLPLLLLSGVSLAFVARRLGRLPRECSPFSASWVSSGISSTAVRHARETRAGSPNSAQ